MFAALGSVLILFAWNEFFMPKKAKPARPPRRSRRARRRPPAPPAAAAAPTPAAPPPAAAVAPSTPEETVVLETPEFRATFTSWGGALKSLTLKEETYRKRGKGEAPDVPIDLVHVREGEPWPLSVLPSAELGGGSDPGTDPLVRAPMRVVAKDATSVTFEGRLGAVDVRKTFQVGAQPYQIDLELAVGGGEKAGTVAILYPAFQAPDAPTAGFFSGGEVFESVIPVCRAGDKTERFDGKEALKVLPGPPRWLGLDQHYFVSALMPQSARGELLLRQAAHRRGEPGRRCASRWTGPPGPPSSSTPAPSRSTCCAPTAATSRPPSTTARSPTTSPSSPGSCSG